MKCARIGPSFSLALCLIAALTVAANKEEAPGRDPKFPAGLIPSPSAHPKGLAAVVLVHGWNIAARELDDKWRAVREALKVNTPEFAKRACLYEYRYDWSKAIDENGKDFADQLAKLPNDVQIVIVAHSMGGLVSRDAIERHWGRAELPDLITLATPHHGSAIANETWFKVDNGVKEWVARHKKKEELHLDDTGTKNLAYDNFDGVIKRDGAGQPLGWAEETAVKFVSQLNEDLSAKGRWKYLRHYTLFAGYIEFIPDLRPSALNSYFVSKAGDANSLSAFLTSRCMVAEDGKVLDFAAADGPVPLISSLFLDNGSPASKFEKDKVEIDESIVRSRMPFGIKYQIFAGVDHSAMQSSPIVARSVASRVSELLRPIDSSIPVGATVMGKAGEDWRKHSDPTAIAGSVSSSKGAADVVFCIDATGSMRDDIEEVKTRAQEIIAKLGDMTDLRLGLVTYRDFGVDGESHLDPKDLVPLTDDFKEVESRIQGIEVRGGGDDPEDVIDGLMKALSLHWRNGVGKFIILIGDAPAKEPDHNGKTYEDVAKLAEEIDPVHVYAVVAGTSGATDSDFAKIADMTGGKSLTVPTAEGVPDAISASVAAAIKEHSDEVGFHGGSSGAGNDPDYLPAAVGIASVVVLILVLRLAQVNRRPSRRR